MKIMSRQLSFFSNIFSFSLVNIMISTDKNHTLFLLWYQGDFVESDERFRSRERGGRKRKCPTVEMLIRKRVSLPSPTQSCNLYED